MAVGAVMIGEPQSMEIAGSRGDRGPKDFGEFIGMLAVGAFIMSIAKARRRGRVGEGGGGERGRRVRRRRRPTASNP